MTQTGHSGPLERALHALPVTPLEQVLGSCLEALGAEHLEAEGVGEPVGRVERGADRQRVLDLLASDTGDQHFPHVLGAHLSLPGQRAEHPQRCPERRLDGGRFQVGQHRCDLWPVLVGLPCGRGVRADAERALIHLGHVGCHQLPVAHRPGGRPAHRLMGELLRPGAVEIGPVEDQLAGVRYRVPGEQLDEREQQLGAGAVAAVENFKAHYPSSSSATASARAARPASYSRADCPTAAHITSSNSSSSPTPAARAAAKSASVTCAGLVATLPSSPSSGGERPALLNARARCSGDALPSPFTMRSCSARKAARLLSSVSTARCTSSTAQPPPRPLTNTTIGTSTDTTSSTGNVPAGRRESGGHSPLGDAATRAPIAQMV